MTEKKNGIFISGACFVYSCASPLTIVWRTEAADGGGARVEIGGVLDSSVEDVRSTSPFSTSSSSKGAGSTLANGLGPDCALSNEARLAVSFSARPKRNERMFREFLKRLQRSRNRFEFPAKIDSRKSV